MEAGEDSGRCEAAPTAVALERSFLPDVSHYDFQGRATAETQSSRVLRLWDQAPRRVIFLPPAPWSVQGSYLHWEGGICADL